MEGQNLTIPVEIKEKARIGGEFRVTVYPVNGVPVVGYCNNLIPDIGIKHLGDILAAVESTDIDLGFIEPGSNTTLPVIGDVDIGTGLPPVDRLPATTQTRSAASPFEVTISAFINSTKYTRPATIRELAIYFGPDESGDLFAHGRLDTFISLPANATATIDYSILFR